MVWIANIAQKYPVICLFKVEYIRKEDHMINISGLVKDPLFNQSECKLLTKYIGG